MKVDEADVGQVRVGQPATFNVDAYPTRELPGADQPGRTSARRPRTVS